MELFKIAIVGAGPAGMSAGARAAARGISHVVLERAATSFAVLRAFMKGKAVMATPKPTEPVEKSTGILSLVRLG